MSTRSQVRIPVLNNRLVMEFDRGRVREMLVVVALAGLMLLPLLAYVWQNVEWVRTGYRIERLKNQRDRLIEVQHKLRLEKTSLESLSRVERVAAGQLGLAQPPAGTVVLVDMDRLPASRLRAPSRVASAATAGAPERRSRDALAGRAD